MKQLSFPFFSVIFLFSCAKDKEAFIPIELKPVERELRNLLPSNSTQHVINSQEQSIIVSDYNLQIQIDPNSFIAPSESSDFPIEFNFVELLSYSDYLSQNIVHITDSNVNNVLYSIYLSANDEGEELSLIDDNKIVVRFPSELYSEDVVIGKGVIENSELQWKFDYPNSSNSIEYVTWTIINDDGTSQKYDGYELSVSETGWYSIAINDNNAMTFSDICVDIISDVVSADNSAVYFLSRETRLLTEAQVSDNEFSFCNYNLPISGTHVDMIAISYNEREESFYFSQESIAVEDITDNVTTFPQPISKIELKEILENL